MAHPDLAVVTGAFGFTGACAVQGLVDQGVRMKTLSRRLADRNHLAGLPGPGRAETLDGGGGRALQHVLFFVG